MVLRRPPRKKTIAERTRKAMAMFSRFKVKAINEAAKIA